MDIEELAELCSGSTRWVTVTRKVAVPAGGPSSTARRRRSSSALGRWVRRQPLTVTVTYRGGAECWYELRARGRSWRVPGAECLHDVMVAIYEGHGGTAAARRDQ